MQLKPDTTLLQACLAFAATGMALTLLRIFSDINISLGSSLWWLCFIIFICIALLDAARIKWSKPIDCARQLPGNLPLGSGAKIKLRFQNDTNRIQSFSYTDHYPAAVITEQLPAELIVAPGQTAIAEYRVKAIKRGEADFGDIQINTLSPLKLWRYRLNIPAQQSTKVYPNFMAVANLNFLDYEQRLAHIGAHISQRRGSGQEFKQLREYQRGDEIRQIDWKATSRQHRLISREYQDERDQEIIFMLDSGRRMRAMDGDLSHFDHSLNALLLTSYIALSAGDAVGYMSFAGNNRWLKPVKGKPAINTLLNHLYDLHSTLDASDLTNAAEQLLIRHQKRSLVIIISNLRDDDTDDLLKAVRMLSRKHLVLVACLKEKCLVEGISEEPESMSEALNYAATKLYSEQRALLIKNLKARGIAVADSTPELMHVSLVNEYMALKRAGKI